MDEPVPDDETATDVSEPRLIAKPPEKRLFPSGLHRLLLPIVCSLAGTAILAVQTYILFQQKKLLATQTEILSLDQSVHIRERIVAASSVDDSVRRLVSAMKAEANTQIDAPARLGGASKIINFSINACQNTKCSDAIADVVFGALAGQNFHIDEDVARDLLRLSEFLERLDFAMERLLSAPAELDLTKVPPDKTLVVSKLIDSGVTQCFFDPGSGRDLSENLARLRLVSGNMHWIQNPLAAPARFQERITVFPQVGINTTTGLERLQAAAFAVMAAAGKDPRQVTIKEFAALMASGYQSALAGLTDLDRVCTAAIARDSNALKSISISPAR